MVHDHYYDHVFYPLANALYIYNCYLLENAINGFLMYHTAVVEISQKLVGRFFEDATFCRLLMTFPLKMYCKFGQPK